MQPPPYFEDIRRRAQARWDQLEADPELAAPWHQLFKQVQSPRHVISELLQNADDAGATKARIAIQDGEFVFSHNGNDFEGEHFASLCRFGYSNKRALHTIGFRGIGFKSTFSLGDEVRLVTPTLSIEFRRDRFTQPQWIEANGAAPEETSIHVSLQDEHRKAEIVKNVDTWLSSPTSLLFFQSLRHLVLGDRDVAWNTVDPGPVTNSEWVILANSDSSPVLLVRSELEEFPAECVAEIRQERMLGDAEDGSFPPSKVELVVGLEGRLFVVLPTGVKAALPFACNAPFIQDPARVKIKDPEISPTNRWLLERAGRLAAHAMLQWLSRRDLPFVERANAYRLLPLDSKFDDSIEGICAEIVSSAFSEEIEEKPVLLTNAGELSDRNGCVATPTWLLNVWDDKQVSALFDTLHRSLFYSLVSPKAKAALIRLGYLTQYGDEHVLTVLQNSHLPRPDTWRKLLSLWAAVLPHVSKQTGNWMPSWKDIRIVPVQARNDLYSAKEVVRLGEKRLLHSESDWDFLSTYLFVMNPNWPRFLAEQRRIGEANEDEELASQVQAAESTLRAIGLADSSDATKVIEQVASSFFSQDEVEIEDCVRLAQIAATLSVQAAGDFEFVTLSGERASRSQTSPLIADARFDFDAFATDAWCSRHVLHSAYWAEFRSCTVQEWNQWLASGRSGLVAFIPLQNQQLEIYSKYELSKQLKQRGHDGVVSFPYVTSHFIIEDWDFPEEHWRHWETLAKSDKAFWSKLVKRIFEQPPGFWENALTAKVFQVSTSRSRRALDAHGLLPAWIVNLRQRECLEDNWGKPRQPVELLRRTAETESLLDVEPFVRAELDTESVRPLLSRLGVRDTPASPDRLLERLAALATVTNPPVFEVQKWCHRLDGLIPKCSTAEFQKIKEAFHSQSLILTSEGGWAKAGEVFLSPDDHDVPGAAIIHDALRPLTIWQKIGVEERPTLELILTWLQGLPKDLRLAPDVLRRVKNLLRRHPHRIWFDCGCWLNLEGEWSEVGSFSYSISMHSLSAWSHLFPAIKKQVADFQGLSADVVHNEPFSNLPSLASRLQERIQGNLFAPAARIFKPWMFALGAGLQRIILESDERVATIHETASRLARTYWQTTSVLETIPYLDGTPAGTARPNDVLWDGTTLFVTDHPVTRLLRQIAKELSRPFDHPEIEDAIKFCIDRSPEHVTEYLEQNFTLAERVENEEAGVTPPLACESGEAEARPNASTFTTDEISVVDASKGIGDGEAAREELSVEDTEDEEVGSAMEEQRVSTRNPTARPKSASLIDRFAESLGFKKETNGDRHFHPDGRWLQKQHGQPFPWEMFAASGDLLKCFWAKEHCLDDEPLQLAADVWEACNRDPETHSLLLAARDGSPLETSGQHLVEMVSQGKLVLFPATYRLVSQEHGALGKEPA